MSCKEDKIMRIVIDDEKIKEEQDILMNDYFINAP